MATTLRSRLDSVLRRRALAAVSFCLLVTTRALHAQFPASVELADAPARARGAIGPMFLGAQFDESRSATENSPAAALAMPELAQPHLVADDFAAWNEADKAASIDDAKQPASSEEGKAAAPMLDSLEKKVAALEEQLKKQADAENKTKEAAAQRFVVRPFGRIHIDGASFSQDADNKAVVGDARNGVDIRRARLGVEGEGFETFFYRFDVDFVTFDATTISRPVIVDAYLDIQNLPLVGNIRAGHFREPMSLDRLDSTHDLPFLERSTAVNTLVPFRNLGGMGFDWNESETVTWSYGLFDENTNEFGEAAKDRAGLACTGRMTWLPYYDELAQGRYLLHLGASYSYRRISNQSRRFNQTPEVVLKEGPQLRTPNFVDTGVINLPDYHVVDFEACAVLGSFSLQGEYLFLSGHEVGRGDLLFQGGYLEGMYWLTGEHRNYLRRQGIFGAVQPHSNFFHVRSDRGIETSWGAWEVTGRVSNLDLDSLNVAGGNLTNLTLGLNWYYAVRSRVMFNYIHSYLDRADRGSSADIFAMRFQYAF